MPDEQKNLNPIEGEVMSGKENTVTEEIREAGKRGGVFIGTLNIMTEPANNYLTEPIAKIYKTKYEKKFKNPLTVFLFDAGLVLLGALAAAAAIYFAFFFKAFEPVSLSLEVLPKNPVSGGEIVIKAGIQNNTTDTVSAELALRLPKTVSVKTSNVHFDRETNTVRFETIESGASAEVRLTAELSGAVGQKQKISGELSYSGLASENKGKTLAAANFSISKSVIGAAFELPEKIIVGQRFSGKIRYSNKGGSDAKDVYLAISWPAGFVLDSADSKAVDGRYALGTIKANTEGTFGWSGTLADISSGADFSANLEAKSGNEYVDQVGTATTPEVTDPKIKLGISGPTAGRLGMNAAYSVEIKNNGAFTLSGADIRIISSDGVTAEKIKDIGHDLAPGDSAKLEADVILPQTLPDALAASSNPTLAFSLIARGKLDGEDVAIASPTWNVKIASRLGIEASGHYWSDEGDQLGRGPIPPEAGKTTRYWVFWSVVNTTNRVSDATVSAKLPAGVAYTGKASVTMGDAPVYDAATRTVIWNAGDIPPFPGSAAATVGAAFEVALTPTAADRGTYPLLLSGIKISGTDSFSGLGLSSTAPDITAKLVNDPRAVNKGPVR